MVGVVAESEEIVRDILERLDQWMRRDQAIGIETRSRTLDATLAIQPASNLVTISVPGHYAGREARQALERGLNVFLFSSNVSVEDELALKRYAYSRGLILMGPDCGTSIVSGIGLGFSNVVRRGPIGMVGAAGTGLQEFTTLVHRWGSGISHAIGTGSRDVSDAIGGISALSVLDALERDVATKLIAIVSKPPGPKTRACIVERISACRKPVVTCFLGVREELPGANVRFRVARTLDEAARLAVQIVTGKTPASTDTLSSVESLVRTAQANLQRRQKYVRGLFAGGTFCYQAQQVLQGLGIRVHSNSPLKDNVPLDNPQQSAEHTRVDMGAEFFTDGRAHPMIDASLRRERILAEANDPSVAVLLLDFILGYNASTDPAGDLVNAIAEARARVHARGNSLPVVASVCGTEGDPQSLKRQIQLLEQTGVLVMTSSAQAAELAGRLVLAQG
jgi:FdrA protein